MKENCNVKVNIVEHSTWLMRHLAHCRYHWHTWRRTMMFWQPTYSPGSGTSSSSESIDSRTAPLSPVLGRRLKGRQWEITVVVVKLFDDWWVAVWHFSGYMRCKWWANTLHDCLSVAHLEVKFLVAIVSKWKIIINGIVRRIGRIKEARRRDNSRVLAIRA